jgi:hypothetical protein
MATVMASQLSVADCYEKLDDTHYLIVSPSEEVEDGSILPVRVACEFLKSLEGKCDLSNVRIDLVEQVVGDKIQSTPIRLDRLARLVELAQVSDVIFPPHLRRVAPTQTSDSGAERPSRGALRANYRFEAIWDTQKEAITTYLCVPDGILCANTSLEVSIDLSDLSLRERSNIEVQGILIGAQQLSKKIELGDRFILGIPLSFDTMCSPYGRSEIARVLRGLPGLYRQYLTFFLMDIPLGVSYSRLTELSMALKPFGRLTASVASGCRNFNAYEGHGFNSLALDLSRSVGDPERTRADILYVAAAGQNMKCGATILNVADQDVLKIVYAADCRQIHGAAISAPTKEPRRMTHVPSKTLMRQSENDDNELWF